MAEGGVSAPCWGEGPQEMMADLYQQWGRDHLGLRVGAQEHQMRETLSGLMGGRVGRWPLS